MKPCMERAFHQVRMTDGFRRLGIYPNFPGGEYFIQFFNSNTYYILSLFCFVVIVIFLFPLFLHDTIQIVNFFNII